jgi:hypothetical protein
MDVYAGSVFDPVSLHKYLYANANPVMFSDPSGYFSLGEMMAAINIQTVIYGAMWGSILGGTIGGVLTYLRGGSPEEIIQGINDGIIGGAILGGAFAALGCLSEAYVWARLLLGCGQGALGLAQ